MKVSVINGSPRKNWNTAKLLNQFMEGMKDSCNDIEINYINIYDYKFSGCRSCFACKLKTFEDQPLACRWKDEITDCIDEVRNSDVVVIGSPIYFLDLSAQLKAFLERLMYPGKSPNVIPLALIMTMNATEEPYKKIILPSVDITCKYWENNFGYYPNLYTSFDTYQRDNEHLYKKSSHDMESKKIRYEQHFDEELRDFYNYGKEFIESLGK